MGRIAKGSRVAAKKQGARSSVRKRKPPVVSARAANRKSKTASFHMIRKVRSKKLRKQTGIEATVESWLLSAKVDYKSEYPISRTHVDFYLPATKTVVEVQGCHWHACQRCNGKGLSKEQLKWRRRDGKRYTFLRNAGYGLVLVWEHEINEDPDEARKKVLKHASVV